MPTQDDATIRVAADRIQTLMAALSGLFSFSNSSDASYLISSLLSQLSQLLAQIATGNYDKEEVRTQLLSSLDAVEKLPSVMGRNAPPEVQQAHRRKRRLSDWRKASPVE